jgi:hypothetical protein
MRVCVDQRRAITRRRALTSLVRRLLSGLMTGCGCRRLSTTQEEGLVMGNRVIATNRGVALSVMAGLVLVGGAARAAQGIPAGDLDDTDPSPYGSAPPVTSPGSASCPKNTWKTSPRLVIHLSEFKGGIVQNQDLMIEAIRNVVNAFNDMGGTSAAVSAPLYTTYDSFTFGKWFHDDTPTIHVGFADAAGFAAATPNVPGAFGATSLPQMTADGCYYGEVHMVFPNVGVTIDDGTGYSVWNFGYPSPTVNSWEVPIPHPFYDAGPTDYIYTRWFRPSFLHELLHAFGMVHTKDQYSFMDHASGGGFPWANRDHNRMIRPLPYEIGILRDLYPPAKADAGAFYDISVLNTWFVAAPASSTAAQPAASQIQLCSPSLGSDWSNSISGQPPLTGLALPTCGVDGNSQGSQKNICGGDKLRTRFTVANASNAKVDVTARLWLSEDEFLDSKDIVSPTSNLKNNVAADKSVMWEVTWKLPAMKDYAKYYAIVQVTSTPAGQGSQADASLIRTDWIPLPGQLQAGSCLPTFEYDTPMLP